MFKFAFYIAFIIIIFNSCDENDVSNNNNQVNNQTNNTTNNTTNNQTNNATNNQTNNSTNNLNNSQTGPYHVVVIGSSTAEGIGPDYGWVDRFRDQLKWINSGHEVTNLAKGGYNSYRYLPSGTVVPDGQFVDTERNITKAISLNPDLIILNNPSNDIWVDNYSIDMLFSNYDVIINEAGSAGIPILVTTSQPTLYEQPQRDLLIAIKDRVLSDLSDIAINFWDGLANADGSTIEGFSAGDSVHLNDDAHLILFQRIMASFPFSLETPETTKVIHYYSQYPAANFHYAADDNSWTAVPGIAMTSEGNNWYYIEVSDQGRIEFVFNNGTGTWDNNNNENYTSILREFWVQNGQIYAVHP